MAQNPLEALRKARTIGAAPRTPYEWSRAKPEDFEIAPLPAPPQPDIIGVFTPPPQPRVTDLSGKPFVPASSQVRNPSGAALAGLQSAQGSGLEVRAPYVRPGAQSPSGAVSTFQAGMPAPSAKLPPSLAEMFQLASRGPQRIGDEEIETTAPGANEFWKQQAAQRISEMEFDTPEARAAREAELAKIGSPERVAETTGKYDVEQQREASRGALAVAESKGEQAQNFLNMLNQQAIGGGNVSRFSVPGMGSASFAPDKGIPTGLLTQLGAAKNAYETAKSRSYFGEPEKEKAVYDAYVSQALGAAPISPASKQEIIMMLTNPELMDLPIQELDLSDFAPEQQQEIVNTLLQIRGLGGQ